MQTSGSNATSLVLQQLKMAWCCVPTTQTKLRFQFKNVSTNHNTAKEQRRGEEEEPEEDQGEELTEDEVKDRKEEGS